MPNSQESKYISHMVVGMVVVVGGSSLCFFEMPAGVAACLPESVVHHDPAVPRTVVAVWRPSDDVPSRVLSLSLDTPTCCLLHGGGADDPCSLLVSLKMYTVGDSDGSLCGSSIEVACHLTRLPLDCHCVT